ncbi:Shikimate dehydrogenase [Pseudodesulfovibrio hydrargyri]|uniref:Shikimate dehydrogenase (NADP(+)) n=1 Tax=Pseudodesulfovibrio hydrargyri TaxID=2125990 RepID=A0A1J5MUL7_9BACT|nr:shikimate dehydrogenase [Pseudodesulfovibrio hydrargyri]OIQ50302.1 Shikimate dehydrogenase [Pseudodesulfovibrio hydrargyri]
MPRAYGIIGWPLGHTMSPALHNWGFAELGLDARYEAWPLEPEDLPAFMERVRTEPIHGLSVTIPHKRAVMAHLDRISDRALAIGAVNTVHWDGDTLCGENTDVIGVVAPLRSLDPLPRSAMVLGAGGAARAAVAGFLELGIPRVAVSNRTQSKGEGLAADFGVACVPWDERMDGGWELVCNTTPLGMSGDMQELTPWDADRFEDGAVAYDIVYNPLETRFLAEAGAAGCRTVSGLEMFLHQGLAQFRLWTGRDMDEAGARRLLLAALRS